MSGESIQLSSTAGAPSSAGPVVTKKLFAQLTGLSEDTVRGMVERGQLPTLKIGRHRMVNIAQLSKEALETEYEL